MDGACVEQRDRHPGFHEYPHLYLRGLSPTQLVVTLDWDDDEARDGLGAKTRRTQSRCSAAAAHAQYTLTIICVSIVSVGVRCRTHFFGGPLVHKTVYCGDM